MLKAAACPAAMARMAVLGPVTQSPPEKTPGLSRTRQASSASIRPRTVGSPASAKWVESLRWPTAMMSRSHLKR